MPASHMLQVRHLDFWDIFNKEKLAKNREKLCVQRITGQRVSLRAPERPRRLNSAAPVPRRNDELRRGYFSDLQDLKARRAVLWVQDGDGLVVCNVSV